jgi:hypothetical protein
MVDALALTDAQLQFLRDEILRVMVKSIAAAKAEALAEVDARILALEGRISHALVMSAVASNMGAGRGWPGARSTLR